VSPPQEKSNLGSYAEGARRYKCIGASLVPHRTRKNSKKESADNGSGELP